MNPDYNTLLRFYRAATGGAYNNIPPVQPQPQNTNTQQISQTQSNVLPPQTVIQVNGKASVDAMKMSPNSSVLLMDTTAPIVWLCTSDGLGNVTSEPYDISKHKEAQTIEVENLSSRVAHIETLLMSMMENTNGNNRGGGKYNGNTKSNDNTNKPRKDSVPAK